MIVGDLVWVRYRGKLRPGVIVRAGRVRFKVYAEDADRVTTVGPEAVMMRGRKSKAPIEDVQHGIAVIEGQNVKGKKKRKRRPGNDPRMIKEGTEAVRGRLGIRGTPFD